MDQVDRPRPSGQIYPDQTSSDPTFGHNDDEQHHLRPLPSLPQLNEKAKMSDAEKEANFLIRQIATLFEQNAAKMKALHDESMQEMLAAVPREVLQMPVGKFLEASKHHAGLAMWANREFKFSDKFNLLSQHTVVQSAAEESKSSSEEFQDALDHAPEQAVVQKVMEDAAVQAFESKAKPVYAEYGMQTESVEEPEVAAKELEEVIQPAVIQHEDVGCQYSEQPMLEVAHEEPIEQPTEKVEKAKKTKKKSTKTKKKSKAAAQASKSVEREEASDGDQKENEIQGRKKSKSRSTSTVKAAKKTVKVVESKDDAEQEEQQTKSAVANKYQNRSRRNRFKNM